MRENTFANKETGANGILMADPAAGLLSPDLCPEFSNFYIKMIIDSVEDDNFIVIYHNCGNTIPLIDSILNTSVKAIHLGNSIELTETIKKYPPDNLVLGNFDVFFHTVKKYYSN